MLVKGIVSVRARVKCCLKVNRWIELMLGKEKTRVR